MGKAIRKQNPVTVFWLMMAFGGAFTAALITVVFWYVSQLHYWVFW
jgi:hypothetical protein